MLGNFDALVGTGNTGRVDGSVHFALFSWGEDDAAKLSAGKNFLGCIPWTGILCTSHSVVFSVEKNT